MQNNSRTYKSLKNSQVAILFYCINLILQFFSRKVFLDFLGSEVLGLNTTAQNLLGFLNLAELGIGSAIAFSLYKPLWDNDKKTINDIISLQGWLYRRIAYIVIVAAIILMFFFPAIFAKTNIPLWYTYGSFIALLTSSLLGYFVNYRQILLSADQKQYKVTYSIQGVNAIKILSQILSIRFFCNGYVWWMALEVLFAVIGAVVLNFTIKKEYPWLKPQIAYGKVLKKEYPYIITKTKQLFFHKIGTFALTQSSPLIIYAYTTLTLVAIYGNYMLIFMGTTSLINALLNGISAGIGNLVAEGQKQKIKSFFWELSALRIWMASVICFSVYMLGHSFITLWVGKEYIMPESAFIVLILLLYIQLSRTCDAFLAAYGLFQDILAPVVEAILNIGLSILFGYYWGLTGILLGVLISQILVIICWKPYFLYTQGFKDNIFEYILQYCKYILILSILFLGCRFIMRNMIVLPQNTYVQWIISAIIIFLFYGLLSLFVLSCIDKPTRAFVHRIYRIVKK